MNLSKIPLGTPEECNVIIEIPLGSSNKYEYDEELDEMILDYVFTDGFCFPFNYGCIPHTKAEDGDMLDAIVLSSYSLQTHMIVKVKPLGVLRLLDRGEQDNKLITVSVVDPLVKKLHSIEDISQEQKQEIIDFFKGIGVQKNKTMEMSGYGDKAEALEEIRKCTEPISIA